MNENTTASTMWILQRVTGVGLIFLLGLHFGVQHFIVGGKNITSDNTVERISTGLVQGDHVLGEIAIDMPALVYQASALLLLAFAVHHGMYGVHNIVVEQDLGERVERASRVFFTVLSLVLVVQGILVFYAFFSP
ncbi:MAG: hypothetical protein ACOCT0_05000 [Halobacteriota archaeon]